MYSLSINDKFDNLKMIIKAEDKLINNMLHRTLSGFPPPPKGGGVTIGNITVIINQDDFIVEYVDLILPLSSLKAKY